MTDSDLESIFKGIFCPKKKLAYEFSIFTIILGDIYRKNSSIKFIELFKRWGHRNLRYTALENLQNFLEWNVELSIIFSKCSAFYSEKFCKFSKTLFRKCLYSQLLHSSINFIELFFSVWIRNIPIYQCSTLDPEKCFILIQEIVF